MKIEKIESLFLSITRELNIDFNPFGNVQRNKISKGLEKSAHESQQLSIKIGVNCKIVKREYLLDGLV